MSRTPKTALRAAAAAALVSLLAGGTASAVTLNHRVAPAATPISSTEAAPTARGLVDTDTNVGSTSVGDPRHNCTRGHLAHGHC